MIVMFCGHRSVSNIDKLENLLFDIIERLIENGAVKFYLGGYGEFDQLCKKVLLKHKKFHLNIELILIVPYLNHNMSTKGYDGVIYPEIEEIPAKFAIVKRNKWMVEKSDFVVAYIEHNFGGAYETFKYAKMKNKDIIFLK